MKLRMLSTLAAVGLLALSLAGCAPSASTPATNEGRQAPAAQPANEQDAAASDGKVASDGKAGEAAPEDAAAVAKQEAASPAALQIVDSGWFAADNGMVDFAVKVQNPNKTVEAVDPVIEVVGKDEAGNVIFDETIETPGVLPDSTYYYSYVAGSTASKGADATTSAKPATVDFAITTPEGSWQATEQKLGDVYAVTDGGAADTEFGAKEFTGTVTASEQLDGATQSRVDVILLDQDGKIEGGYFKIVDTEPGKAADYDIYAVGAPEFASYAVYASPWTEEAAETAE